MQCNIMAPIAAAEQAAQDEQTIIEEKDNFSSR